jgi:hypothetical protein
MPADPKTGGRTSKEQSGGALLEAGVNWKSNLNWGAVMKYVICLAVLVGCASVKDENHSPQRKADYAACEENSPSGASWFLGAGVAQAMQINDCMKAKGY